MILASKQHLRERVRSMQLDVSQMRTLQLPLQVQVVGCHPTLVKVVAESTRVKVATVIVVRVS